MYTIQAIEDDAVQPEDYQGSLDYQQNKYQFAYADDPSIIPYEADEEPSRPRLDSKTIPRVEAELEPGMLAIPY